MIEYISHAHTPEELKSEVCSDLRRRIAVLDAYSRDIARGAAERARLGRAASELADMLQYWSSVRIERPKTKRELDRERRISDNKGISSSVTLPHISSSPRSRKDISNA